MGINLQSLKYMAQGFKKVALKDTKGVLTKKNNFKWVRDRLDRIETIFPTGTRVSASKVVRPVFADKIITKPDGTVITSYIHCNIQGNNAAFRNNASLRITKASKGAPEEFLKSGSIEDMQLQYKYNSLGEIEKRFLI